MLEISPGDAMMNRLMILNSGFWAFSILCLNLVVVAQTTSESEGNSTTTALDLDNSSTQSSTASIPLTGSSIRSTGSSTVRSTSSTSSTTYLPAITSPSPTTFISTTRTRAIDAIPTTAFTGQGVLTGGCSIPSYTLLNFQDGSQIVVPLIGCSDDRPECCPSVNISATPTAPWMTSSTNSTLSTTTFTGNTLSLTPTGVVSLLSEHPITICPSDMVDIAPVCCPTGFTQYSQQIVGDYACASNLISSSIPIPSSVLASIRSSTLPNVVAAVVTSPAVSASAAVNIIVNQVFAIGIPRADYMPPPQDSSGLSTGSKIWIGLGLALGCVALLALWIFMIVRRRRASKSSDSSTQEGDSHDEQSQRGRSQDRQVQDQEVEGNQVQGQQMQQSSVRDEIVAPLARPRSPPPLYTPPQLTTRKSAEIDGIERQRAELRAYETFTMRRGELPNSNPIDSKPEFA